MNGKGSMHQAAPRDDESGIFVGLAADPGPGGTRWS
jgi:hypothetical protein